METAAAHLVRRVPVARTDETAGQVRDTLPGRVFDSVDVVCVVDSSGVLRGIVELAALLAAAPDRVLSDLARTDLPRIVPETDQEQVATAAIHNGLGDVPVVDDGGKLLGVVPARAILRILRHEHIEDIHRLAGIEREAEHAREVLREPPMRRLRDRLPWLLVGLVGSSIATWIVSRFEKALEARVAVAFFIPGIVYLADAIGTQTEAIAVRGLSFDPPPARRLFGGEIRTGLFIGIVLAAIVFPAVAVSFGDVRLALSVAIALLFAGTTATTLGLLLPWLLLRAGKDPAFGSGPMATVLQDVVSLLVYFVVVALIL